MKAVISSDYGLNFVVSPMTRRVVACEDIRFSSLFVAGDVSRGNVPSDEEKRMLSPAKRVAGIFPFKPELYKS